MSRTSPPASRILLKDLSPLQYSRLSELLDEYREISDVDRVSWFEGLERSDPAVAAVLHDLIAAQKACEVEGFLVRPAPFAGDLASLGFADTRLVGKQYGPYRVLSLLGRGGMGSVWLAERVDGLFERQVALKLIHPALIGRVMTERFTREREILASLNHPNIARLSDAGFSEDGQPFLALEYIAGTPFTTYCDNRELPVRERLQLFRQILSAVQYAHAHLVIHRDLKPSNILVTDEGRVHLLDFGIAKLLTESDTGALQLTQIGGVALTPDYAAPEQISGAPITTAADVYSLGVMLYELLASQRPYRLVRATRGALEEAILKAEPVPPSRLLLSDAEAQARGTTPKKLARLLKGDLDTIVVKSLKKPPAERYASANAFDEDLGRYLRGDVVLAQRDSVGYRALKFSRRYRVAIAAAGTLILTLACGLAATTYEAHLASVQRDAALQAQLRSLTQAAAARLGTADIPSAMNVILEVLPQRDAQRSYTPEALSVFQQARATDAQVMALTGHADRVRSAVFSADGRRVVTASWDKTARIWDAATGVALTSLVGHTDRVWSAAFSPDGRRVVTASHDKTARIWDAATGQQTVLLAGHADRVTCAAFSPDGRLVATTSYDKTVRIWDAASGDQIRVLNGHTDLVMSAAFSGDGSRLLTASHDKTARVWEVATGRQLLQLSGHTDWLNSAVFSPDGRQIVTASFDKTAGIWDATTGQQLRLLSGHSDRLLFAAFSPDGHRIATASYDKTARLWDAETGREILRLLGHTAEVAGAAISPDGQRLITASYDKTARLWDIGPGREIMLLGGHTEPVASASFSPDGLRVVTASYDRTARVWDAASGRELMRFSGHTDQVVNAAFSPDGQRIVTSSPDGTARIWDTGSGRTLRTLAGHTDQVVSASFSPDGQRIVTASLDKTARIWEAATGREIMQLIGHTDMVETAEFSRDGRRIVTASHDKTARIWDAASGRTLLVLSGHTERVESAAFSPDGKRVVTASADKSARIWDAATGRPLAVLTGHADLVEIAAFSSDGRRVVTASDDKTARIWEVETGHELLVLSGHRDRLWYAAFSPDGDRVVTASDDRSARIWDAKAPPLDVQIVWADAAQFDPLSSDQRFQLGLRALSDARPWEVDSSPCDQSAGALYDPDRHAPGVMPDRIVANVAMEACAQKNGVDLDARSQYQRGRALAASGHFSAAKQDFEASLARGYGAARVDLGLLLSQPSAALLDVPAAISLWESAWNNGLTIAAFELGSLYEFGVYRGGANSAVVMPADATRARAWYEKAAAAGDPNALARLAEFEDGAAVAKPDIAQRNSHLLQAFKRYAAAAEHARREDWPDDIWRDWRYRRASLARLLARDGMTTEVAHAYEGVTMGNSDKHLMSDE
jgi:WD40 repeat protein/serine/threonine protein kinase